MRSALFIAMVAAAPTAEAVRLWLSHQLGWLSQTALSPFPRPALTTLLTPWYAPSRPACC